MHPCTGKWILIHHATRKSSLPFLSLNFFSVKWAEGREPIALSEQSRSPWVYRKSCKGGLFTVLMESTLREVSASQGQDPSRSVKRLGAAGGPAEAQHRLSARPLEASL